MIPYIIEDSQGNLSINNLTLDANKAGKINLDGFGTQYASLTIIPIAQNRIAGFNGIQPSYSFFWSASTKAPQEKKDEVKKDEVLVDAAKEQQVAALKSQIMAIQLKIIELLKQLIQLLLTGVSPSASM